MVLNLVERKKYAKVNSVMECGIWGKDLNCIADVEYTTREGHRNSWKNMVSDIGKLDFI